MWVGDDIFGEMIERTIINLKALGFKVLVAHGHGPSNRSFVAKTEEFEKKYGIRLINVNLSEELPQLDRKFRFISDHAAANETSIMWYYYPTSVHMEQLDPDPSVLPLGVFSGADPRTHASREYGKQVRDINLDRMEKIIKKVLSETKYQ